MHQQILKLAVGFVFAPLLIGCSNKGPAEAALKAAEEAVGRDKSGCCEVSA